ncbi:MAG: peptidylprolyl isomerase [Pseudomonadota bacterium]
MKTPGMIILTSLLVLSLPLPGVVAEAEEPAPQSEQPKLFAMVGEAPITEQEYDDALKRAYRQRFYHGKPPEGELEKLRQEVASEVITRQLLLQEARRLGLSPDMPAIQTQLDEYDQRYAGSPRWQQQREQLLGSLKPRLQDDDLLRQLESRQRKVAPPGREQLMAYYKANPEKFTEPAQHRIALILLKVDPSSPTSVWEAATAEGGVLVSQLREGADFAELARLHSSEASAENGGDMGYLHAGMLSPAAEEVIKELAVGDISDPVRLLEGIAIFRVDDRKLARLREYEDVSKRARELWIRDQSDSAWARLKEQLRDKTPVTIYSNSLPPLNNEV